MLVGWESSRDERSNRCTRAESPGHGEKVEAMRPWRRPPSVPAARRVAVEIAVRPRRSEPKEAKAGVPSERDRSCGDSPLAGANRHRTEREAFSVHHEAAAEIL